MGLAQGLNAQTYDTLAVFGVAGGLYLAMNGLLTIGFRWCEKTGAGIPILRSSDLPLYGKEKCRKTVLLLQLFVFPSNFCSRMFRGSQNP